MTAEVVNLLSLLNDNQGLDIPEVDTLEEGVIQHKKREVLKDVVKKGKAYLLGDNKPWTIDQVDKANEKLIDKLYQNYTQYEIQYKAEKVGRAIWEPFVNIYTNGITKLLEIYNLKQLKKDIINDPSIKDSMMDIGALMVLTFGKYLSPLLILCYTAKHSKWAHIKIEDENQNENQNENQDENQDVAFPS